MRIEDLLNMGTGQVIETDLCIIGSGPAGLTVARELVGVGIRILILESGGLDRNDEDEALSQLENFGAPRNIDQTFYRNRVFGGTSLTWTGRCASFDDMDYAVRSWVPFSGWPIGREALAPYIDRAARHVGIGPDRPEGRGDFPAGLAPRAKLDSSLLRTVSWQFSQDAADPQDFMRFGPAFRALPAPNVRILLHATATHLTTDPSGSRLESVEVATPEGTRALVRARAAVLCGGGIENARLLLCSNRIAPAGIGNAHDLVGRFLMDHPRAMLMQFDMRDLAAIRGLFGPYKLNSKRGRHVFVDGMALSPEVQRREELLNCAVWLDEIRAEDDPLDAMKRLTSGSNRKVVRDAWTVVSQSDFVLRALHARYVRGTSTTHKLDRFGFTCSVEQRPDPDSRLRLGGRRDRFGLPVAEVDWRIGDQEKASLARLARLVQQEFARLGLPSPKLADWIVGGRFDEAEFEDAAHPVGTTRMASDPRRGVVDENGQVHGVEGLFVTGSSVFPTAGHANPTLLIVALAVRLADWLKTRHFDQAVPTVHAVPGDLLPENSSDVSY